MARQEHRQHDDLDPARGVVFGTLIGIAFWALIATLVLASRPAQAEDFTSAKSRRIELLAGQCKAEPLGDGNWYSESYPHDLNLRSTCWSLSISEIIGAWRGWDTGIRFGYVHLGTMSLDAVWWLRDEDYHRRPDGMSCTLGVDGNARNCLGNGHLEQTVRGFTLGGLLEREVARGLRVGVEGGVYVYEGGFKTWLEPYPHPDSYVGWTGEYDGLQLSPYLGATLNYGIFMLSTRVYTRIRAAEHGCGGCSGPTRGPATQLAAGLSLPF